MGKIQYSANVQKVKVMWMWTLISEDLQVEYLQMAKLAIEKDAVIQFALSLLIHE